MKSRIIWLSFIIISISSVLSLYGSNSNVVKLTQANFNKEVVNSKDIWLVEFFGIL